MTGYHKSTDPYKDKHYKQYNTHNLWGMMETMATHTYFTEKLKKRPFIITRS